VKRKDRLLVDLDRRDCRWPRARRGAAPKGVAMKYELHPACAVWPEMQPEALQELADDIALNGLHEP
jgi:hypothetical protein